MATESGLLAVSVEELAVRGWQDAEAVLKYRDVVRQALVNAVKKTRSYVLRYEYVLDEIYALIRDEDEAWRVDVALYSILILVNLKIGDVAGWSMRAGRPLCVNILNRNVGGR
jgi:hypothetical protein